MKMYNYYSAIYYVVPELDGQIVRLSVRSQSAAHTDERRIYNMILYLVPLNQGLVVVLHAKLFYFTP